MNVRSALQSTVYVLAIALALVLLVVVVVFGAIFALAHHNRRPGYSYLTSRMTSVQSQG
jgi:hypothetical protein